MPQYKMLWLLDLDYYLPSWLLRTDPQKIIREVYAKHFDGVDVWAGKILNNTFVSTFKEKGLLFYVWTVDDTGKAKKLLDLGVDAITTNRAAWLKEQLPL